MNLDLTEDQQAIEETLLQIVERHRDIPVGESGYVLSGAALERDLEAGGFLDIALTEGFGLLEAVILVDAVSRSPRATNVMARGLVWPVLMGSPSESPVALGEDLVKPPVRFLTEGGSILLTDDTAVRLVRLGPGDVEPQSSFWAVPFGRLKTNQAPTVKGLKADRMRHLWRLGLTAEIVGASDAAIATTVEYVKQRKAFNQVLGAFQAIQHRLSECAVQLTAARTLLRWAAWTGQPQDAALAATFAQEAAARIIYDCQQFHGAIGLTLEYPLHFWTYRLRLLLGELGGWTAQSEAAAELLWPEGQAIGDPIAA